MSWEQELASAYRNLDQLVQAGLVSEVEATKLAQVASRYQFLIPTYYANLIDKNDPNCPIRKQAIPSVDESDDGELELSDPLQDLQHRPSERITHRYKNRALFHLTSNCSMYCRFCFRKTLLNELKAELFSGSLGKALEYLKDTPAIEEVIFSGGDPLMVSDETLRQVLSQLDLIPHIKRVRFHTRVPVTFPSRITQELAQVLTRYRFKPIIVTHFNHPKEITEPSRTAVGKLKDGMTLLNQSVLLKGVNDSAVTLSELSERLFEIGILPYYLHQLDPSKGTGHFRVDLECGKRIWEELRVRLPGYLVPRYVMDVVESPFKVEVDRMMSAR